MDGLNWTSWAGKLRGCAEFRTVAFRQGVNERRKQAVAAVVSEAMGEAVDRLLSEE